MKSAAKDILGFSGSCCSHHWPFTVSLIAFAASTSARYQSASSADTERELTTVITPLPANIPLRWDSSVPSHPTAAG
jgi:hypothetical protein